MDKKHSNTVIRDTSKQNHSSVPNTHIVKDNLNEVGKNKKEKSVNNFNRNHTNNETIIQKKSTKLSYSNNHLNSGSQNSEEVKISNLHDEIPNVETLNSKKKILNCPIKIQEFNLIIIVSVEEIKIRN